MEHLNVCTKCYWTNNTHAPECPTRFPKTAADCKSTLPEGVCPECLYYVATFGHAPNCGRKSAITDWLVSKIKEIEIRMDRDQAMIRHLKEFIKDL